MPEKVKMKLAGLDGNAFFLMGAFQREARHQGWTPAEIAAVIDECRKSDYDHLLRTLLANTTTVGLDNSGDDDDFDEDYEDDEGC